MKFWLDFFPLLLFFIAYKVWNIFVATGVLMAASLLQIVILWFWQKRVGSQYWIAFILIMLFGGLTIYFHDPAFLKWKVSIINWLFGAAFLLSGWLTRKTLIERMMGGNVSLPKPVYQRLNGMWGWFMIGLGTLNAVVAHFYSTAIWVDFKVFGMTALTVIFLVIQAVYLVRVMKSRQH